MTSFSALALAFLAFPPMFPTDASINVQLVMRWVHFVAGITWIGLLYFFNLINASFMRGLDPAVRAKIYAPLMSRAMSWFRWSSVVTVLAGFGYWNMIVVADSRNAHANGGFAIWTFLLIWTVAAVIEIGVVMSPADALKSGPVLSAIVSVLIIASSWLYVSLNSHGWESNRLLSIGIGGGIGWFMMFNVWGIVWRIQKKMIRWAADAANGAPLPTEAAQLARVSLIISRINFVLSFPLLFFMAAASHYPFLIG